VDDMVRIIKKPSTVNRSKINSNNFEFDYDSASVSLSNLYAEISQRFLSEEVNTDDENSEKLICKKSDLKCLGCPIAKNCPQLY
jgi:hypothetical protein